MKRFTPSVKYGVFKRFASTSRPLPPVTKTSVKSGSKSKDGSPFDSSFTFQMFLIVGAMGAGYTLGKTSITNSPPATLFPKGSTTSYDDLKDLKDDLTYDKFKRCILRVLEAKNIEIDVKNGHNESLYQEKYCNEEIATLMNDIDGLGDVFFGKKEDIWKGKQFKLFPETTQDVSNILKLCNEFGVPVYTTNFGNEASGLCFQLDFTNFNGVERSNDYLSIDIGAPVLDFRLNGLDLFLKTCGIITADMSHRSINGVAVESIEEITAVLADGTIVNASKYSNSSEHELFKFLTTFSNQLCLITNVKIDSDKNNERLIIIGTNTTNKLNETIAEVSNKLPELNISVVDSQSSMTKRYGDYNSFAVFKANPTQLKSLNKRYSNGEEGNDYKIISLTENDIHQQQNNQYFVSASSISANGLLITDNVIKSSFKPFSPGSPVEESSKDSQSSSQDTLRRLKLSMDANGVLNKGLIINVAHEKED